MAHLVKVVALALFTALTFVAFVPVAAAIDAETAPLLLPTVVVLTGMIIVHAPSLRQSWSRGAAASAISFLGAPLLAHSLAIADISLPNAPAHDPATTSGLISFVLGGLLMVAALVISSGADREEQPGPAAEHGRDSGPPAARVQRHDPV